MFQALVNLLMSPFTEILIFVVLFIAFFVLRKDPRLVVSGFRLFRTLILVLIFFYLMFVWVSAIRPALSAISVFGMFVINLFMLYNLIQARLERPYRDALAIVAKEPLKHEPIHEVWHKGKRFYYFRYAWSSLFSGINPVQFLHTLATDRVRNDIKDELRRYGVEQKLISLPMMAGYLKSQAACDDTLPVEFRELMTKVINDFAKHPWIEEQVNNFLQMAVESPEDLHFPEWMQNFEACVRAYKKR